MTSNPLVGTRQINARIDTHLPDAVSDTDRAAVLCHPAHHRGQIALALGSAGHPLDAETACGLRE